MSRRPSPDSHLPVAREIRSIFTANKGTSPVVDAIAVRSQTRGSLARDFIELTKPEITFLVALSSLGGFVLAPIEHFDAVALVSLLVGVCLTSAGASTLNHWLERDKDALMRRTMNRPLPTGRISPNTARNFGFFLIAAGVGLLCPLTNPLTGSIALATALIYLFVYTPLKQRSTWNTLVGTLPGALPALGGWTAATGSIGWGGAAMFGILAAWQMPHFLSLAWMYRKDYERAGYVMLPVAQPDGASTVRQTLLYTILLVVLSFAPIMLGLSGWLYFIGAAALGIWFLHAATAFYRSYSMQDARRVLRVSIGYIPVLVLVLLLDRVVFGGLLF